jgi:hypothetical protein
MVYCFLDHGELEIDNNATEREIKVLVMERKNFSRPFHYVKYEDYAILLPWNNATLLSESEGASDVA